MSNLGKIIVIGAVGVVAYYQFYKKEEIPITKELTKSAQGMMKEVSNDYADNRVGADRADIGREKSADNNATIPQDEAQNSEATGNGENAENAENQGQ